MLEIGSSLREARRRRNLELTQVEQATRIRVQQLEALEQERFERLPPDPYRRSFLREYADFLGLDGDLYTSEYDRRFHRPELAAPPPRRRSAGASRRPARRLRLTGTIIVIALLLGAGAWWLGRSGGPTVPRTETTLAQPQKPAHHRSTQSPKPAPSRATVLVIRATRGSCWLLVRRGSATGPTVYQQTLQPGRTLRLGVHQGLWIRIGAPWNLDATIGGQPLVLPSRIGNVLATAAGFTPAR
jgi:transcriptional regulator with XRE-family HTH domain